MGEPDKRVFIQHITIIFGGFLVMFLQNRLPGLIVRPGLKTVIDLRAHQKEHSRGLP